MKPALFFLDVGSHTTAPHYIAIDSRRQVRLAVADVNIFQNSWSHPWMGASGDKVHLLWTWGDVSIHKNALGMGMFHVEWSNGRLSRKMRIVADVVKQFDAAIDPQSGRLLIVFSKDDDYEHVFVISRSLDGVGHGRAQLPIRIAKSDTDASVSATSGGAFIIRIGSTDTKEWVLNPR